MPCETRKARQNCPAHSVCAEPKNTRKYPTVTTPRPALRQPIAGVVLCALLAPTALVIPAGAVDTNTDDQIDLVEYVTDYDTEELEYVVEDEATSDISDDQDPNSTELTTADALVLGDMATASTASGASFDIADITADVLLDIIDNPTTDPLGLELREELRGSANRDALQRALAAVGDVSDEELAGVLADAEYAEAHSQELANTVLPLSELGNPVADQKRTHQDFHFDNRDLTGVMVDPSNPDLVTTTDNGKTTANIVVYIDSAAPKTPVSLSYRQIGRVDSNS